VLAEDAVRQDVSLAGPEDPFASRKDAFRPFLGKAQAITATTNHFFEASDFIPSKQKVLHLPLPCMYFQRFKRYPAIKDRPWPKKKNPMLAIWHMSLPW